MAVVVEIPLAYGREAEMQLRNGKKPSLEVAPTTLAQRTRQTTRNRSRPDVSKMNILPYIHKIRCICFIGLQETVLYVRHYY